MEQLSRFNWVDIAVIVLLLRIYYTALGSGLPAELFKLLGSVSAIYLSLHYYTAVADYLRGHLAFVEEKIPLEFLDFVCLVFTAVLGYLFFVGLRFTFQRFVKMEAVPRLNKWGGFVLGLFRGILVASLLLFMLSTSSISYLKQSVARSFSAGYLFKIAASTYSVMWNNLLSKFMVREKFNSTVLEVEEDLHL